MDLPFDFDCYRELRDYFDARSDVPPRLLAPGPKNNQVIIFQAKGPLPPTHSVRGNFRREVMYLCWWLVGRQLLGNHPTWREMDESGTFAIRMSILSGLEWEFPKKHISNIIV